MTHADEHLADNLQPLTDLHNYRIEDGDPDPRGYTVVTSDGESLGRVDDLIIDTAAMKVRYLLVDRSGISDRSGIAASGDNSNRILVPVETVEIRGEFSQVIAPSLTGQERVWSRQYSGPPAATTERHHTRTEHDRTRMTRSEEELNVGKKEVARGEARVAKRVETEHVSQPVTRRREELVVERRPVEAGARADASIGADEIRVPIMEEEVVVEKRPVVKEELIVGKRIVEERDTVEADLRREEFDVQNVDGDNPRRTPRGER